MRSAFLGYDAWLGEMLRFNAEAQRRREWATKAN